MDHMTIRVSAAAFDEFANAIFASDDTAMMNERFEQPALIRGPILLDGLRLELKRDVDWKERLEKDLQAQNLTHEAVKRLKDVATAGALREVPRQKAPAGTPYSDYMARLGFAIADEDKADFFPGMPPIIEFGKASQIFAWTTLGVIGALAAVALGFSLATILEHAAALLQWD